MIYFYVTAAAQFRLIAIYKKGIKDELNAAEKKKLNENSMDPWPESWAATWYDNDVYLDYSGDGYYLYNRNSPGVGIAVTVSF